MKSIVNLKREIIRVRLLKFGKRPAHVANNCLSCWAVITTRNISWIPLYQTFTRNRRFLVICFVIRSQKFVNSQLSCSTITSKLNSRNWLKELTSFAETGQTGQLARARTRAAQILRNSIPVIANPLVQCHPHARIYYVEIGVQNVATLFHVFLQVPILALLDFLQSDSVKLKRRDWVSICENDDSPDCLREQTIRN